MASVFLAAAFLAAGLLGGLLGALLGSGLLFGSCLFLGLFLLGLSSQLEGARGTSSLSLDKDLLLGHVLEGFLDKGSKFDHIDLVVGGNVLLDGREGGAIPLLSEP